MTSLEPTMPLILASNSAARQSLLCRAGPDFTVIPSDLDEAASKMELQRQDTQAPAQEIAGALACAKARSVAQGYPDALVIRADQVLSADDELFNKAAEPATAAAELKRLAGRRYKPHATVCVMRGEKLMWQHSETANIWMRPLSDDFIAGYLDRAGAEVLWSVGYYQIEGLGVQLFDSIEGDYFTILGLPLLLLPAFLRTQAEGSRESTWQ